MLHELLTFTRARWPGQNLSENPMSVLFRLFALIFLLAPAALADAYRVRPGDTLRLEVIEDSSLDRTVLVPPDGRLAIPMAGSVLAAGRSVDQIRADLSAKLADKFAYPPTITLSISGVAPIAQPSEDETISVYVLGEVGQPGRIEVEPGTTVLQVFSLAGGFSPFAATKRIQLRRTTKDEESIHRLNYNAIERGQSASGSLRVTHGDTFVVPVRRLFE